MLINLLTEDVPNRRTCERVTKLIRFYSSCLSKISNTWKLKSTAAVGEMSADDLDESKKIRGKNAEYDHFWVCTKTDLDKWSPRLTTSKSRQRSRTSKKKWQ